MVIILHCIHIFTLTIHASFSSHIMYIVTNGRVAWLIKRGFGLVTGFIHLDCNYDRLQSLGAISSTALIVHLDQLLLQHLLSIGSSLNTIQDQLASLSVFVGPQRIH
jgi:hypothetical protein